MVGEGSHTDKQAALPCPSGTIRCWSCPTHMVPSMQVSRARVMLIAKWQPSLMWIESMHVQVSSIDFIFAAIISQKSMGHFYDWEIIFIFSCELRSFFSDGSLWACESGSGFEKNIDWLVDM